jgi:hypothetical protein
MKQFLFALALAGCIFTSNAQEAMQENKQEVERLNSPSKGDYYEGLTRPLTFNRMIPPYALEVTFSKTVHIIFPSAIRYVDLGSADLLAAKSGRGGECTPCESCLA